MPQLTVESFLAKTDEAGNPKKDNYGNTQMMIKFTEHPETVYKAVKDPSTITKGKVMYGTIVEGQYGFKFQADPYNQPGTAPTTAPQPAQQGSIVLEQSEILDLVKDNNRMLKLLVGDSDTNEATEPDFGG